MPEETYLGLFVIEKDLIKQPVGIILPLTLIARHSRRVDEVLNSFQHSGLSRSLYSMSWNVSKCA
jgi:hypothetical protein